jgi:hypothetical protein
MHELRHAGPGPSSPFGPSPRARQIARELHAHLPVDDDDEAIDVLLASLGPLLDGSELSGMAASFSQGDHLVELMVNGASHPAGTFVIV